LFSKLSSEKTIHGLQKMDSELGQNPITFCECLYFFRFKTQNRNYLVFYLNKIKQAIAGNQNFWREILSLL